MRHVTRTDKSWNIDSRLADIADQAWFLDWGLPVPSQRPTVVPRLHLKCCGGCLRSQCLSHSLHVARDPVDRHLGNESGAVVCTSAAIAGALQTGVRNIQLFPFGTPPRRSAAGSPQATRPIVDSRVPLFFAWRTPPESFRDNYLELQSSKQHAAMKAHSLRALNLLLSNVLGPCNGGVNRDGQACSTGLPQLCQARNSHLQNRITVFAAIASTSHTMPMRVFHARAPTLATTVTFWSCVVKVCQRPVTNPAYHQHLIPVLGASKMTCMCLRL